MADASALDRYRQAELTLSDLVDSVAKLLIQFDVRPGDGRVSPEPDARGVRYYQARGILDRPLRYDGRRAVYGFRHLLQLLAVKRFQQEGQPLHLIQQSLAGCPTAVLEQAVGSVILGLDPVSQAEASETNLQSPSVPVAASVPRSREPAPPPSQLLAVRLAPGVTVTIDRALVSDADALVARVAAAVSSMTPAPLTRGASRRA